VFIRTPEILGISVVSDMCFLYQIGEIFRFTAFLTREPLNCSYLETTSTYARIFRQTRLETSALEVERMSAENLDLLIKHYFFRKGFRSEQQIVQLQNITGQLCIALCMILHCFSSSPDIIKTGRQWRPAKFRKPKAEQQPFDRAQDQAVHQFYQELLKSKDKCMHYSDNNTLFERNSSTTDSLSPRGSPESLCSTTDSSTDHRKPT